MSSDNPQTKTGEEVIIEADYTGTNRPPFVLYVFGILLAGLGVLFCYVINALAGGFFILLGGITVIIAIVLTATTDKTPKSMMLTDKRVFGHNKKQGSFDVAVNDITHIERGPTALVLHTRKDSVLVPYCRNTNAICEAIEAKIKKASSVSARPNPPYISQKTQEKPLVSANAYTSPTKPSADRSKKAMVVKYEYLQKKLTVVQNMLVKMRTTLESVGYTLPESQLRDDLLLFCVSILAAKGSVNREQLYALNTLLGYSFTEGQLKGYLTSEAGNVSFDDMEIFAVGVSLDNAGTLGTDNSQYFFDIFAEVGYAIVCASEHIDPAQEKRYDALMKNIRDRLCEERNGAPLSETTLSPELLGTGRENPYACKHMGCMVPTDVAKELDKRSIPKTPLFEYRSPIDPYHVALYPQNGIEGSFAIVTGMTLHLVNLCALSVGEGRIRTYNDAQGLRDTMLAGMIGGPLMGMMVGAASENHTVIEEVAFPLTDTETNTTFDIVFSKNETYSKDEWLKVFESAQEFSSKMNQLFNQVSDVQKIRHVSYATYGRENPRLTKAAMEHMA